MTLRIPIHTSRYGAIDLYNPLEQPVDPMLKVFLLIAELLMYSFSILFFSAEMSSPQY